MKRRAISLPLVVLTMAAGAAWFMHASAVAERKPISAAAAQLPNNAQPLDVRSQVDRVDQREMGEPESAAAADITGSGSIIYVDDDAAIGGNGQSWGTAFKFLQDALTAASTGDEIHIAGGGYHPDRNDANPSGVFDIQASFALKNGVSVLGGFAGLADPPNPGVRDIAAYETVLSAGILDGVAIHVFNHPAGLALDNTAVLDGCTIRDASNSYDGTAGGMYNQNCHPTIRNCTFTNNRVYKGNGGGMYNDGSNPRIIDCKFVGNFAKYDGGGMHNIGSSPTLIRCIFEGNSTEASGGGMFNSSGNLTLTDCVFRDNETWISGGGMVNSSCTVMLTRCEFTNNAAVGGGGPFEHGGGAMTNSASDVTLFDCILEDNSGYSYGGGMWNNGGNIKAANCTFNKNWAEWGAGINMSAACNVTMVNCTATGNQSGQWGGFLWAEGGSLSAVNCLFVRNPGAESGSMVVENVGAALTFTNCTFFRTYEYIYGYSEIDVWSAVSASQVSVRNCIFWPYTGESPFNVAGDNVLDVRYSCVGDETPGDGIVFPGTGNIDINPGFVADAGPGTGGWGADDYYYGDLRLPPGSPCNDAGDTTALPADALDVDTNGNITEQIPIDLIGEDRVLDDPGAPDVGIADGTGSIVDMGAFEMDVEDWNVTGLAGTLEPPTMTCQAGTCRCDPSDPACDSRFEVGAICGGNEDCLISRADSAVVVSSICENGACVGGDSEGEQCTEDIHCEAPKAFYYPGDDEWYAIEHGLLEMSWRNTEGDEIAAAQYTVLSKATEANNVFETNYYIDALPGSGSPAFVPVSPAYNTTIRYNSTIKENSEPGNLADKDIKTVSGLFQIRDGVPSGKVVIHYTDGAPPHNPTVGFEVLELSQFGLVKTFAEEVGRRIIPPQESDDICGAEFIKNEIAGQPVAWARQILSTGGIFTTTDIWPIRPSDVGSRLQIVWYRRSANQHVDLETCWPIDITKHTAAWPTDPQINVIDADEPENGPTVKLQSGDGERYCHVYRVYQEGFDGTGVLAHGEPGQDLGETFAAQNTGYSVIRFESNPGGVGSACGDVVTFEVVATYDHHDYDDPTSPATGEPNYGAPIYDGAPVTEDIGVSLEQPSEHHHDTPYYPYGYLHSGLPYADNIYEGDGPAVTGQIFAVNRTDMYDTVEDGELEVWYFMPGRDATGGDTASGDFAEGVYWPHKVFRYDVDWPTTTEQIVIENRNGAHCVGTGCEGDGGYPLPAIVYSKGLYDTRYIDKQTVPGWNPNDEHAQLIPSGDGALKAYAVRDDDVWGIGEEPYVLVYYPIEPAAPASVEEVNEWGMGIHEVVASETDPDCHWTGEDDGSFDCFIFDGFNPSNIVYAGAPVNPPLYPVNYFAELCVDQFSRPLSYVYNAPNEPTTALWADRTGLIWAVEDYTDGRDLDFALGTESSSQLYLWENWIGDDIDGVNGGCDPWRDFGTGKPTPITYTPTWPDVPPDCNWEGGDENCARLVKIGETISHGVNAQCGTINFLHDSVSAVVIDPLECAAAYMDNAMAMSQLDFSVLPPHLGGGEYSGGGFEVPARVEYVTAGYPMDLHEEAKCGDFLSETLLFVGIMTKRDREFMLKMGNLLETDCYDNGELIPGQEVDRPYCYIVDELYEESRRQLGVRCLGGVNDGEVCTTDDDCPALCDPECVGGFMDGTVCNTANGHADCLPTNGTCTSLECVGGTQDGEACTNDLDCRTILDIPPYGTCIGVCSGGTEDGEACTDNSGCVSEPDVSICVETCPPGVCREYTQERPHVISLAGADAKPGWITVSFQNDAYCADEGAVVAVEVWNVDCGPTTGRINVIEADCPFSEAVVLQHSGDAGGEPETLSYEWQVSLDYNPLDHGDNPDLATWTTYSASGLGKREVILNGNLDPVYTLIDSWWRVRYRGYTGCQCGGAGEPACPSDWPQFLSEEAPSLDDTAVSDFTKPALSEGWIKRVIRKFNAFDQRIEEFHTTEIATYVNMIRQAGIRYEGPVALNCNPDNINSLGLIETYATVLARARQFLGGALLTETPDAANLALLLAASKISDLYMLLGNEAFADALDPTIGLFASGGDVPAPSAPSSIFCFQGQLPDLLAEELALLRGIDQIRDLDIEPVTGSIAATVYNRLPWNFTSTDGQIAYANNYQVTGVIDATGEDGAMIRYPQGHGDAWGHYLTATKEFYKLLTSDFFNWVVSTEAVNVAGQAVPVTFEYERKFAAAAAAKARTGSAVASMTFRQLYSAEPGQKHGYPDSDSDRRWGVADWGRRAGQAAYLDWVIVNSLLDDEDTEHEEGSIQKVDRTTVADIAEIANSFDEIQSVMDNADADLNPLGLANNVVPFGLNPSSIEDGLTHFDQVFDRAIWSLAQTLRLFEHANENDQQLRAVQDSAEEFDELVDEAEIDFTDRLIEIFGRPYPEDIGPGGTYVAGYDGPDLLHFAYVEPSALLSQDGVNADGNSVTYTRTYDWATVSYNTDAGVPDINVFGVTIPCEELTGGGYEGTADGGVCTGTIDVDFNISTEGWGLIKPSGWSQRLEPGEIQLARSEMLQVFGEYLQAVARYEEQLANIKIQLAAVEQTTNLSRNTMSIKIGQHVGTTIMEAAIAVAEQVAEGLRLAGEGARGGLDAAGDASDINLVVGLANGTNAPGKVIKGTLKATGSVTKAGFDIGAQVADGVKRALQLAMDGANRHAELVIYANEAELAIGGEVRELQRLFVGLYAMELEVLTIMEALEAASGNYRSTLGRGLRILEQRTAFRQRSARQVSEYRYQDMAFRIFRNDALQKYRAQFDLSAQYAFLTAKAYDYETALLGTDTAAGQQFLSNIVKERVVGQVAESFEEWIPLPGAGVAGQLASLQANHNVLRTQLGFNNDALELSRVFSLRWENYRIPNTDAYDAEWRQELRDGVVPDIRMIPEYRQFALPLTYDGPIPAIVLQFSTDITTGHNLFGWPSTGDELYPTTYFAIKLHSAGVRFEDYPGAPLNNQVEVYILPTGADMMRVPSCTNPRVRAWNLMDQTLPVPFPVGEDDFGEADWMPWDGVIGGADAFVQRRLYPTIPARALDDDYESDLSYIFTGRSVWNTKWTLIIPGIALQGLDPDDGIDVFIDGDSTSDGVSDIKLLFNSYGYSGCSISKSAGGDHAEGPDTVDSLSDFADIEQGDVTTEPEEFVPQPVMFDYPEGGLSPDIRR